MSLLGWGQLQAWLGSYPDSPQAHEQDASVEQEHGQTETQELNSQQLRGPQKPSAQGESV